MPTLLKTLELTELSLVDRPANPEAMAPIFKRDDSKGDEMPEVIKQEDFKALQAEVTKMKDENEKLRKFLLDNDYVIKADTIEKKAPVEQIEIEGEMINKADIPAPVLKALEAAEVEKAEAAIEKKADEILPHFNKDVAKALLKFDLDDTVVEALKAADAAFEAAMTENGDADVDGDMGDTEAQLEKMIKDHMDTHKVNKFAAYAEVAKTKEGKALINKSYKKGDE